jgi:hypothetical protein
MKRLTVIIIWTGIVLSLANGIHAQANLQPTPPPLVTANGEPWFLNGEPVFYAGNLYYPAGPQTHFNGNEMVPSGLYQAIALYTRTTIEPLSIVYVPLTGGLMQPYERRRVGVIAGTVGSTTPMFRVISPFEQRAESLLGTSILPQAPAPPMLATAVTPEAVAVQQTAAVVMSTMPVGTSGSVATPRRLAATTAVRPQGLNGVFVEFNNQRWFSSGPPTVFDPDQFTRIGEHHGFPVYTKKSATGVSIYIPVARDASDFVAPYTRRRSR